MSRIPLTRRLPPVMERSPAQDDLGVILGAAGGAVICIVVLDVIRRVGSRRQT